MYNGKIMLGEEERIGQVIRIYLYIIKYYVSFKNYDYF